MRKFYWYVTAYAKKHGIVFLSSIAVAILVFSFVIPSIVSSLENTKRTYIGLIGNYTLENLPLEVTGQISSGLTSVSTDGSTLPLLAERWTVEQDGTAYRFLLKDTIFWQDGKKLETKDVRYAFNDVETIITPNDIIFKLAEPFAPFPTAVSLPLLRQVEETHALFFTRPTLVGVGEYRLIDYKKKGSRISQVTLEGNGERKVYRFYLTNADAVAAFKHGEVDVLPNLASKYVVSEWDTTTTTTTLDKQKYLAVFFNIRNPIFSKNIRQALAYATEKPNDDSRASGPISPNSWSYLPAGKSYDKDLNRAIERLLDEPPQEKLAIELTTLAIYKQEAESIKAQWEELGALAKEACMTKASITDKASCEFAAITVNLKITNFPDTNDFQMLLIGQESPTDPDQYTLWHSGANTNFTGYKNTRIDNLLEKGRQTMNVQERKEIYQEFQQFFLEDAPAVFIKHLHTYTVERV